MEFPDKQWLRILDFWKRGQEKLPLVVRWSKYLDEPPGVRRQDTLQHTYAMLELTDMFVTRLRRYIKLDGLLLMRAVMLHDAGEGELGADTLYQDKTMQGDVHEYLAFAESLKSLEPDIAAEFNLAFLLQFALKGDFSAFPPAAQTELETLANANYFEALAFEAIERWDYVLYALEQYLDKKNERIFVQVLRNQTPHLNRLALDLPGFGVEVWKTATRQWCEEFLAANQMMQSG
jgi:hypothetical protein